MARDTTPAPPARLTLDTRAAPVGDSRDGEQIRVGDGVAINYDLGPRGARYEHKRPGTRLWVRGLGMVDEDQAVELAREILTGVAELRRLHGGHDPDDVTGGDHGVRLSVVPVADGD